MDGIKRGAYIRNYGFDPQEAMRKGNVKQSSAVERGQARHTNTKTNTNTNTKTKTNTNTKTNTETKDFKKSSENGTPSGAEPSEPVQHGAEMIAAWLAQYGKRNRKSKGGNSRWAA